MNSWFDRLGLSQTERRLVVVVSLVVFMVLNYWLVWPHFGDLAKERGRVAELRAKQDDYRAKIAKTDEFDERLEELKNGGASIPVFDRRNSLQRIIGPQARKSGVTLLKNQPIPGKGEGGEGSNFLEAAVNLSVTTDDDELIDFLVSLGESDAMIRVRDMNLSPSRDKRSLSGVLTLVASYYKSPDSRESSERKTERESKL